MICCGLRITWYHDKLRKVADRYTPWGQACKKRKETVKTALGLAAASLTLLCIEAPNGAVLCSLSARHKDNQGVDALRCSKIQDHTLVKVTYNFYNFRSC